MPPETGCHEVVDNNHLKGIGSQSFQPPETGEDARSADPSKDQGNHAAHVVAKVYFDFFTTMYYKVLMNFNKFVP